MIENHVIFQIGGQSYSASSVKVKTIEATCRIEPLPGAPENVLGVVGIRGTYVPVYSLHKKFGVPLTMTKTTQYLFLETSQGLVGIVADAVKEMAMVDVTEKEEVPVIVKNESTNYVAGILRHKGELVTMINPDGIVSVAEGTTLSRCLKDKNEAAKEE